MSGFSLSGYKATVIRGEIDKIEVRLTVTSKHAGSYDKTFRFKTSTAKQSLKISLRSPEVGPGGKRRFYMGRIRIDVNDVDEHVSHLEYVHPETNEDAVEYGRDVLKDLPEHTNSVTLHLTMEPQAKFYLSVVALDRNTGAEIDCDPQASNDPETRLHEEIFSMLSAFSDRMQISMDEAPEGASIEIES